MTEAVKFWIARELVSIGLFFAILLAAALFVTCRVAIIRWQERKRRKP